MVICILCGFWICPYDGFIPGCLNIFVVSHCGAGLCLLRHCQLCILCILVFALRCWTVPYYGTVSCVYYVFLDIPLTWACRFCVKFIYSLLVHQGTRQGLK